jgi:arylsulfatase A-like enzyme
VDLAPTILEFLKLKVPPEMQGRSILPETPAGPKDRSVFGEHYKQRGDGIMTYHFVIQGHLKLRERTEDGIRHFSLYDLKTNPEESKNLLRNSQSAPPAHLLRILERFKLRNRQHKWTVPPKGRIVADPDVERRMRALGYVDNISEK